MDDGYLSHLPLLAAAMTIASGPALELGAGLGSTFLLHGLCGVSGWELLTIESDAGWMQKFQNYERTWHRFKRVENFLELPEYRRGWGIVFVT